METKLNKKELFCGLLSGFLANLLGMIIVVIVLFQSFNILKIINKSEELKLYESISENAKEFIKKNNSLELFTSQEVDDYKYILNNN